VRTIIYTEFDSVTGGRLSFSLSETRPRQKSDETTRGRKCFRARTLAAAEAPTNKIETVSGMAIFMAPAPRETNCHLRRSAVLPGSSGPKKTKN